MNNPPETFFAFIDSQNLKRSVENQIYNSKDRLVYPGWPLCFKKFRLYLRNKFKVSKAILFIGRVPGNEGLYANLESFGYEMVYKPTLQFKNSSGDIETKGNVDAELVLHTMIEFHNYDRAIIVAGDGDYFCLVEYLEKRQKLGNLLIPNKNRYSKLLNPFAKYMVFISDLESSLRR
jgi:hypothetical protein